MHDLKQSSISEAEGAKNGRPLSGHTPPGDNVHNWYVLQPRTLPAIFAHRNNTFCSMQEDTNIYNQPLP